MTAVEKQEKIAKNPVDKQEGSRKYNVEDCEICLICRQ
jgi:hypothetical protein